MALVTPDLETVARLRFGKSLADLEPAEREWIDSQSAERDRRVADAAAGAAFTKALVEDAVPLADLLKALPGVAKWSMHEGGTGAARGKHGYTHATDHGTYSIQPVSNQHGWHQGYQAHFQNTKGALGGGLWHDLGMHRSPQGAASACSAHHSQHFSGEPVAKAAGTAPESYPRKALAEQLRGAYLACAIRKALGGDCDVETEETSEMGCKNCGASEGKDAHGKCVKCHKPFDKKVQDPDEDEDDDSGDDDDDDPDGDGGSDGGSDGQSGGSVAKAMAAAGICSKCGYALQKGVCKSCGHMEKAAAHSEPAPGESAAAADVPAGDSAVAKGPAWNRTRATEILKAVALPDLSKWNKTTLGNKPALHHEAGTVPGTKSASRHYYIRENGPNDHSLHIATGEHHNTFGAQTTVIGHHRSASEAHAHAVRHWAGGGGTM